MLVLMWMATVMMRMTGNVFDNHDSDDHDILPVAAIVVDEEMPLPLIEPLVVDMFPLVVDILPPVVEMLSIATMVPHDEIELAPLVV